MSQIFWQKLKKPFFCLAPMSDVTDATFREMVTKLGKPNVIFTEFVSTDGLCSEGKKAMLGNLYYQENERPIVAQLFGSKPENFYKAAKSIKKLGFDGIDINMGCPQKIILKQGAGAALIQKTKLAGKIIKATIDGAGGLPVSVKTRIGYTRIDEYREWIPFLLQQRIAALTIHLRTAKEMYKGKAHWEVMEELKVKSKKLKVRDKNNKTLLIGNGDVQSLDEAYTKAEQYELDGIMIGRAAIGNPWIFSGRKESDISMEKRLQVLLEHVKLFQRFYLSKNPETGQRKNFHDLKKYFKAYVSGFDGAKELRMKFMKAESVGKVEQIVRSKIKIS